MDNKRIFIIGGSGSLGNELIKRYIKTNTIINYSRCENKHWKMELEYGKKNITNIIGDISDKKKLKQSIIEQNPHIIIIAAAMKHIDKCEYDFMSSIKNNLNGMSNVYDILVSHYTKITNLQSVLFVSTDKASNPISIYGMCKSLSEKISQSIAYKLRHTSIKSVVIRYGNVINSNGSIIQIIKDRIKNNQDLMVTDIRMTRYIMTLQDSIDLLEYALLHGVSGDIVVTIPKSMNIKDLVELFCEKHNCKYTIGSIRFIEKLHEELVNETQSMYIYTNPTNKYLHISSHFHNDIELNKNVFSRVSNDSILTKEELKKYLQDQMLL